METTDIVINNIAFHLCLECGNVDPNTDYTTRTQLEDIAEQIQHLCAAAVPYKGRPLVRLTGYPKNYENDCVCVMIEAAGRQHKLYIMPPLHQDPVREEIIEQAKALWDQTFDITVTPDGELALD